jgi:nitroreductase
MITCPDAPKPDAMLAPSQQSEAVLSFLNTRRSSPAPLLRAPGPTGKALQNLLRLAMRVPDHRRLSPWRVVVIEGDGREKAGALFAARYTQLYPDATAECLALERRRFCCAPTVLAIISSPDIAHKTPVWEQELSTGAFCYNLLLSANASGWAGCWLTGWVTFDEGIAKAFDLKTHERFAGFLHLGTSTMPVRERPRPDAEAHISYWRG